MTNRTLTRSMLAAAAAGVLALSACSSDSSTKPADTTAAETAAAETSAAPSPEETQSSEPATDTETGQSSAGAGVEGTFNDADVQIDDEKGAGTPQGVAKEFMTGFIDENPKVVCAVISPNEEEALAAEGGCEASLIEFLEEQKMPANATLEGATYTVKAKDDTTAFVEIRRPGNPTPFTLHTEQVDGRWYAKR